MKIIYCINAVTNSGGMERILQYKANYLADVLNYEVLIVTTEQGGLPAFFPFSSKIRFVDLNVNYGDRADKKRKNIIWKVIWKSFCKLKHKKKISRVLMKERADIVITLFNNDIGFLPSIKDGSKKISEFHFTRAYKEMEARNIVIKYVQKLRCLFWKKELSKFDYFVVLTNEDKEAWGHMNNIVVIPNFIPLLPERRSNCENKRVIAVGRAEYEKGFDMLIEAWSQLADSCPDWHLDIFGNGDKEKLTQQIDKNGMDERITLHPATSDIATEYVKSSLYVLSSRHEGLPMVLLEAMAFGLPIVSFECPCGPKDIIRNDFGSLVPNGDIEGLANAMMKWMSDEDMRIKGGRAARIEVQQYSQDVIMKKWIELFES